jgi:outer membrane protein TolC
VEVFDVQNSFRQAQQSYFTAEAEVQRTLLQLGWLSGAPFFQEIAP